MAQHISILNNNNIPKYLQKISQGIVNKVERFKNRNSLLKGCLRYEEIEDNCYKVNDNDRVFLNYRTINNIAEVFEIHFDNKKKEIINIFWVK